MMKVEGDAGIIDWPAILEGDELREYKLLLTVIVGEPGGSVLLLGMKLLLPKKPVIV